MKLKKLLLLLAVMGMFFTSCHREENFSEKIAGTYRGWSDASCAYFSSYAASHGTTTETLSLTAEAVENQVSLSYASAAWGTFTIAGATVVKTDGVYKIAGSGTCAMAHQGTTKEYSCTLVANVTDASNAVFTFSIPDVMGGLTITFTAGDAGAYQLVGSYIGWMNASCAYFENYAETHGTTADTLTLSAGNTSNLSMNFASAAWGTYVCNNLSVSGKTFSGSGICSMSMGGQANDYDCTVSGSFNGDGKLVVTFTIPSVMGGLTTTFTEGEIPDEYQQTTKFAWK